MAAARTLVTVTWSLQRIRHGEQPVWAGIALAAMLGQIGLPGGGFGHGYGSMGNIGADGADVRLPTLAQGANPVRSFIPVARIADMLLHPGGRFDYDGQRLTYPDIRLVYWAGGNPFHHHQDLGRLRRAFGRPGHGRGARAALDRHRPARRHRAAGHHHPGARGHRRRAARQPPHRHAPGRRPGGRGPRRLRGAVRPGRAARRRPRPSPRAGRRGSGWSTCTASGGTGSRGRGTRCRAFAEFWADGQVALPAGPATVHAVRAVPRRPATARRCATPSGRIELFSADRRRLRLRRLPRPPGLAGARRVAGRPAGTPVPAAPDRQPARHPAAQPARRRRGQPGRPRWPAARRSGCTRPTPRPAASPTATWSGCSTTAARAWPARC